MIKQVLKRFMAMLLSIIMVCLLLPVTAMAATLEGLYPEGITATADGSWTVIGGNSITGSTSCSGCDGTGSAELKFTNVKENTVRLIFDYVVTITGTGEVMVGNKSITSSGSGNYTSDVDGDGALTIKIDVSTSDDNATSSAKIEITNFSAVSVDAESSLTIKKVDGGTCYLNGIKVTDENYKVGPQKSIEKYVVKVEPNEGYKFAGWYDAESNKILSSDAESTFYFDRDYIIEARLISSDTPQFDVGQKRFYDLGEAANYAESSTEKTIVLVGDGVLKGQYVIPKDVTLLIPFDEAGTLYTTTPAYTTTAEKPKVYRTLTMASGSSITVNGAISVGGKHFTSSGQECCKPTGAYGLIKMQEGSSITLNNGANLYAWGYITGDGNITANSGANVYEYYQVTDWRGGSQTGDMANNKQKVFPFTQYYVQNIEAALTLNAGANEYTYISVTASFIGTKSATIPFVGSNGLFKLGADGQFTKRYIPAQDRMVFTISGEASLNSIAISVAGVSVDSKDYVLPINNNVDIVITDGTTTIEKDAALLPGVTVLTAKDAELKVASAASLYVYDDAEWSPNYVWGGNSSGIKPVSYSPSGKGPRGIADAKVDVNGVLTVEGAVYTTATGANITSSEGTGKYAQVGAPGTSNKTYQFNQNSKEYIGVDITPAKLHNADGTYTETKDAKAGDVINYVNGVWGGEAPTELTVTFEANGNAEYPVEGTMPSQTVTAKKDTALNANTFTREGYNFLNWNTAADGTGDSYADGETVNLTENTTLYAQWEIQKFTVTWVNDDGTELEKDENVEYGTTPEYTGETPTKAGDAQYTYTFGGWDPEISKVTANVTYKAVYEKTVNTYTVTWKNWDGTILGTAQVEYDTVPEYTGETPVRESTDQYTYAFAGWTPEITAVTENAEYTATFTDTIRTYTVTWKNWDGTVLETDENVEYGATPEYNGEMPTRPADEQYTYTFTGWLPAVSAVTGDVIYTAVFSETLNKYTITWKNGNEVLKTEQVDYGSMPVYSGETPVKDGNAQYSYIFTGWTPEITAVTGDAEYTAVFEQKVNTYTVTWKNGDNILKQDKLEYGETPAYEGEAPVKEADEKYNYIFAGWEPEISPVEADITYNAKFNAEERVFYTITFNANGGAGSMKPQIIEKGNSAILSGNLFNRNDGYGFAGWNTVQEPTEENPGMNYSDEAEVTPTENMTLYAQWKFMNGWLTDETGKQYYIDGEVQKTGWTVISGSTYYLDIETGYAATGLCELVPKGGTEEALCAFDADGVFQGDKTGLYDVDNDTYWINSGIVEKDKGLTQVKDENGNNLYYYFAEDGNAVKNVPTGGQDFWISKEKTNELLPEWGYYFDENGIIPHDEQFQNGICEDGGVKYYYIDGIKVHMGMFKIGEDYYYAKSNGQLIVNGSYYCSRMNDLLPEGTYTFDAEGKAILPDTSKNGIIAEDDSLYYYVKGERNYAGLIEIDGDYYYVKTSGEVVHGCRYWITKTNGLMAEHSYEFAEDGKMLNPEIKDTSKNGIVAENDSLYYYEDGIRTYAGLIEIDGSYYYVRTNGELVHGRSYWVTKTNGLMGERSYTFADDGKMLDPQIKDNTKDGIVSENGTMFYYKDGVKTYAGLIEIDGSYYYVKTSGEVIHGRKYWISKTNGLMKEGSYTFADDGKMILN